MTNFIGALLLLFGAFGCSWHDKSVKIPLRAGSLGIALAIPEADAAELAKADYADVTAICPAGGTDPAREQHITPFRGVPIGSLYQRKGYAAVELHFPYSYNGLYTVLLSKACRELRIIPSSATLSARQADGAVPVMAAAVKKPVKPDTRPQFNATPFSVDESQILFIKPGDKADMYFVCDRWPRYMNEYTKQDRKKEWMSIKPYNKIQVLQTSKEAASSSVILAPNPVGPDPESIALLREIARDCTLFLARRAPGDESSAGMTGVTLTDYGFGDKWEHWVAKPAADK